ncbi:MAG: DUF3226 domain-containing protein [Chloroflexota bacterium]
MARPRENKAAPRKLLVEGKDDLYVVANLCGQNGIAMPETFFINDKDGIENLLSTLSVELNASELQALGILVDADTDIQARWQSIRDILIREGLSVPAQPTPNGTILYTEDKPKVGIWLMPDNQPHDGLPGLLEQFVAELIPGDDTLWPYAQNCVGNIPEQRFSEVARAKANIHTWLAWQEEPGKPMGTAITARYLDPDSARAQDFISWLRALFIS